MNSGHKAELHRRSNATRLLPQADGFGKAGLFRSDTSTEGNVRVFISYSHRNEAVWGQLYTHFAPLRREGLIEAWFDREILPGGEIDAEIAHELDACDLFLLLVSPDFLASDYCVEREMSRALERHEAGEARVIPIIVDSVYDFRYFM